ncbi:MAG: peptide chain release factor N(5)-glutamine methyltransferase [Lachnospiraceae bacterium]|nr:peptide chain release factor N(5)-glutamine methyltransferase [Lachnospiraceae bacterium]
MYSANGPVRSMKEWLEYGVGFLEAHQIPDAGTDAWILLEYTANINKNFYYMHMHEPMDAGDAEDYALLIHRRAEHIPVQYLTGEAWFYGRSFRVNESVLIPRQDTEVLVEEALKRIRPEMRVLDLCTGSGCILLTVLKEAAVTGVGSDISPDALVVAELNRKRLNVQANFICSDLFEHIGGTFDMILSNPPYICSDVILTLDPEVRDHEPHLALDGSHDGLFFYRRIVQEAPDYLNAGGWLCLEIGYDQGGELQKLLKESEKFINIQVIRDLSGLDRVACAQLKGE